MLKEELGVGVIPNIMVFSGDPVVVVDTTVAEPDVIPDKAVPDMMIPTAPQTADFTMLGTAILMLSGAIAAYTAKKKIH